MARLVGACVVLDSKPIGAQDKHGRAMSNWLVLPYGMSVAVFIAAILFPEPLPLGPVNMIVGGVFGFFGTVAGICLHERWRHD
jgi:hypothetical protein